MEQDGSEEVFGVVYEITCLSGARYIGMTTKPVAERWREHQWGAEEGGPDSRKSPLSMAISAYGTDGFSIRTIASARGHSNLRAVEAALIQQERTLWPNGLNKSPGCVDLREWSRTGFNPPANPALGVRGRPLGYRVMSNAERSRRQRLLDAPRRKLEKEASAAIREADLTGAEIPEPWLSRLRAIQRKIRMLEGLDAGPQATREARMEAA